MKYIIKLLGILLVCLVTHSCKDDGIEPVTFTIDSTNVTLKSGQAGSVDILLATNTSEVSATVSNNCSQWLTAETTQRCLTLNYLKNDSGEERTGTVRLHIGTEEVIVTITVPPYLESKYDYYTVGDVYYEDGKAVGVIFWVDPADNTIAKAVSLDRVGGAWSTIGTEFVGAYSKVNGRANTEILRNSTEGKNGSIPALTFCDAHGDGWYWPAIEELKDLFAAYNGTTIDEASNTAGGNDKEKVSRAAFDKIFTDNGGIAMDLSSSGNGESYWSSTEDNSKANYSKYGTNVRFRKFAVNMGAGECKKTGTTRYIRCVKALGDYKFGAEPIEVTFTLDKEAVTLEKGAGSQATVTANINNGSIISAIPEDNSWCESTIDVDKITLKATSENPNTTTRSTIVVVTLAGLDGKTYIKNITVTQEANLAPIESSYTVGEYYDKDGVKGVIFWVSDDGLTAKIVSMTRTTSTSAWCTDEKEYGVTDKDDGVGNTAKMITANDGNVPALDMCVNGWYWPAINELKALFEAYNGTTYDSATKKTPDQITDAEKTSRAAFDKTLTDNGGTALNVASGNGDQYWGSTELSEKYGSYLRVGKLYCGEVADTPKKTASDKRYIRVIRQIGKNAQSPL